MKKKIAFVCVGNSCRSQMAEGFARKYGSDLLEISSAGTMPAFQIAPHAIEVMKEKGIDITNQYPKGLSDIPDKVDILIKMGCEVICPACENIDEEDWGLADPIGKPIELYRKIRDIIEQKVKQLIDKLTTDEHSHKKKGIKPLKTQINTDKITF